MIKLILLLSLVGASLGTSCLDCICIKESYGCNPIGCNRDRGSISCGYFQIKKPYYIDCGTPGKNFDESVETAWKRCADDKDCATTCVNNYVNKYAYRCSGKSDCETMARLHNGGLNGCKTSATNSYWNDISSCCGCT